MDIKNVENLKSRVNELNLKSVRYIKHKPIRTVEDGVKEIGISFDHGVSTLIFRSGEQYIAFYRRDDRKLNSGKLKKVLGLKSLNMATPEEILNQFGFTVGAVGVFHPRLKYYMDKYLFEKNEVFGGTGIDTEDIVISPEELRLLSSAEVIDVTDASDLRSSKKRILTGDRPTGKLHIGHLFGSLQNRVKLQDEYEEFVLIANIHALADNFNNPEKVRNSIVELLCDYYAVGIDFAKTTVYIQSEVPEVHEIFMYLANFATVQQIMHNPTIKTELKQNNMEKSTPLGFFVYPIHQAADILLVNADLVPVGKDQAPMIEDAREIARKFNSTYKVNVLNSPHALFGTEVNVPGIDGNAKMGKSLGNGIYLCDTESELRDKVKKIYTDPSRIHATDPGKIEGNVAFAYHDLFNENLEEVQDLKDRYVLGKVGDVEVKEKLFIAMNKKLTPIRERRLEAEGRRAEFLDIAMEGSKKVQRIGRGIADQMKEAMKIKF